MMWQATDALFIGAKYEAQQQRAGHHAGEYEHGGAAGNSGGKGDAHTAHKARHSDDAAHDARRLCCSRKKATSIASPGT